MAAGDMELMATMRKVLWGNGDPEKGLIMKVQRIEDTLARIEKFISKAFWAIIFGFISVCGTIIAAEFLTHWK